jgi:hypothetical protein
MNILFICGGLQPGEDGVGDYTRRLAGELTRQGHRSTIIAISDVGANEPIEECQIDSGSSLQVLRLPKFSSWSERLLLVKDWIKNECPDWISLQFVPFAFHDKGLPMSLARHLKGISSKYKWHIMFHEIWVGPENIKFWILGQVQKHLIASLIKTLKANVVHTHLPLYYDDLKALGIQVKQLPLFSNFGTPKISAEGNSGTFRVGFFNQVANDDQVVDFLQSLYDEATRNEMKFEVLLIGGARSSIKNFGTRLEEIPQFKEKIFYTGFLAKDKITPALLSCTLGMTPLAYSTLGKSGTSAAFLSSGVPIAVPNLDFRQKPFFDVEISEALVTEPKLEQISKASIAAKRCQQTLHVQRIANMFLNDLDNGTNDN